MKGNWKRKGRIVLPVLEDKNSWEKLREHDKKIGLNLEQSKRERKSAFWKVLNNEEHMKNLSFKKLFEQFSIDRKTSSIDRKLHSIDRASIEPGRFKPNF